MANTVQKNEPENKAPAKQQAAEVLFAPFISLQREINKLFEDSFENYANLPSMWTGGLQKSMPHVDVKEDDKEFHITTKLPTDRPEDVEVSITDNYLTIKCNSEQKNQEKSDKGSRVLYSSQSSQRTVMLPETANADKAEAEVKDGMLKINIPKREDAVQKARKITVKKGK